MTGDSIATAGRDPKRAGIAFVGFMAAGKTSTAGAVAGDLGLPHIDIDGELEKRLGSSINSWFVEHGEARFREEEERLTLELLDRGPAVFSLGGGALQSDRVRAAVGRHLCVWCQVDVQTAWRRARKSGRPLAVDEKTFRARYDERISTYEAVANVYLRPNDRRGTAELSGWLRKLTERPQLRMIWSQSPSGEYPAVIGPGALDLVPEDRRWFTVADKRAFGHQGHRLPGHLTNRPQDVLLFQVKEGSKTFAAAEQISTALVDWRANRQDGVIAFGGGVVGDLAGFCAAIYHRDGIAVLQAPTTLLAQVDSAYGGKTGVNLRTAKHQVGAYHMPLAVLADTRTLATVPHRELASGFVEAIKTALIAGEGLWHRVRDLAALEPESLYGVIVDCARTKIDIVERDERETADRAWLNLGHTVGHAIEVATGYRRYKHGEAVGLGLLAVLRLTGAEELREEVRVLLHRHGLPTHLRRSVSTEKVLKAVHTDKKRSFVVLDEPGELQRGVAFSDAEIRTVVDELKRPLMRRSRPQARAVPRLVTRA